MSTLSRPTAKFCRLFKPAGIAVLIVSVPGPKPIYVLDEVWGRNYSADTVNTDDSKAGKL